MSSESSIDFERLIEEIINDSILTKTCKESLLEYSKMDDVHSTLNVTFKEALLSVWSIIRDHENKDEIKNILSQEMLDSMCKCFTGRLSRLVNCLNGFDERVTIKIEDSQEISNVIITFKQRYSNIDELKEAVKIELLNRGYPENVIQEWIAYIE